MLANLNKPARLLLGGITLWPLVYLGLFFVFFAFTFLSFSTGMPPDPSAPAPLFRWFGAIFMLHCFTIGLSFALVALYIVDIFRTERIPADTKALWAVVIFLGNMLAMPIYWYLYVWRVPVRPPAEPGGHVM